MQQIATQAGVSTATLYRWLDNKHAILLEAYLEKTHSSLLTDACGAAQREMNINSQRDPNGPSAEGAKKALTEEKIHAIRMKLDESDVLPKPSYA